MGKHREKLTGMKKKILMFLLISIVLTFILIKLNYFTSQFEGRYELGEVEFPVHNETIFIQAKAWGLAGNHEEVKISNISLGNTALCNTAKCRCMLFYTDEVYYRKENEDSLIIHVSKSSFPKSTYCLKSGVHISVNSIKGYDNVLHYKLHYKDYGLTRVSVYK